MRPPRVSSSLTGSAALPTPLLAAASHAWLVYIHPFRDGNGRTARAITNLLLIRSGYPVVVIRRKDRQRYYEALRASDQADITPLLELMVERSDDSLKQIDRVRTEVSGVSVAAQLMRQQEEARFRVWLDGLRLLASTLEEMFKQAESADPAFRVAVQHYDHPTVEDFRELCAGNSAGNTWLLQFRLSRGGVGHRILCWIGYSSTDLNRALSVPGHIPSIKLSVPNPSAPPPWVEPDHFFPSSAREFAYFKGQYYRVEAPPAGVRTIRFDSAPALASQFVQELLVGWYVTPNV